MRKMKVSKKIQSKKLDPRKPLERREIIRRAVEKTIKDYGKTLEKLSKE